MEAKDTVNYSVEEINGTTFLPPDYISWREHINLMEAQAGISFKAGKTELVEWLKEHNGAQPSPFRGLRLSREDWQTLANPISSSIKEAGIE